MRTRTNAGGTVRSAARAFATTDPRMWPVTGADAGYAVPADPRCPHAVTRADGTEHDETGRGAAR
jgi:hypothetical protein